MAGASAFGGPASHTNCLFDFWGVTFGLLRPVWTPQKNALNLVVKRAPVRTVWAEFLVENEIIEHAEV